MPRPQPIFLLGGGKRPRILSSKADREIVSALIASDAAGVERGAEHPRFRRLGEALAGLLYLGSDDGKAARLLEESVTTRWEGRGTWDHGFLGRYFLSVEFQLGLTYQRLGVEVVFKESLELAARTLKLALSLALEGSGDMARAVEVAREVEPQFLNRDVLRLVLADQYAQLGDFEAIVRLTDGIANKYNYGAMLCAYRGMAFRNLGLHGTALEAFREALRSEQRLPAIRFAALSERSRTYQDAGSAMLAAKDLRRILAERPSAPGIRERLDALGG